MNYFTPDVTCGWTASTMKPRSWPPRKIGKKRCPATANSCKRIRKDLPRGLRTLVESVYLHDARVLAMHQSEKDFLITLQPPSDPERLVVLGYSLVEEPIISQNVLPPDHRREPIQWLYDELELDRAEGPRGLPAPAGRPTIRHNILLSNGWELCCVFAPFGSSGRFG